MRIVRINSEGVVVVSGSLTRGLKDSILSMCCSLLHVTIFNDFKMMTLWYDDRPCRGLKGFDQDKLYMYEWHERAHALGPETDAQYEKVKTC